jgi:hypothetical protein
MSPDNEPNIGDYARWTDNAGVEHVGTIRAFCGTWRGLYAWVELNDGTLSTVDIGTMQAFR